MINYQSKFRQIVLFFLLCTTEVGILPLAPPPVRINRSTSTWAKPTGKENLKVSISGILIFQAPKSSNLAIYLRTSLMFHSVLEPKILSTTTSSSCSCQVITSSFWRRKHKPKTRYDHLDKSKYECVRSFQVSF